MSVRTVFRVDVIFVTTWLSFAGEKDFNARREMYACALARTLLKRKDTSAFEVEFRVELG